MTYLAFEAIGLDRVRTECSVSYLDHNLLYVDNKTPDDHIYLQSAAKKFGVYVSRPGQRHLPYRSCIPFWCARQGIDGRRQSHTAWRRDRYAVYRCRRHGCSNGDDGCSDASDDARVVRANLTGKLRPGCNSKEVILEMLRRVTIKGGLGNVYEYVGPAVARWRFRHVRLSQTWVRKWARPLPFSRQMHR